MAESQTRKKIHTESIYGKFSRYPEEVLSKKTIIEFDLVEKNGKNINENQKRNVGFGKERLE